MIQEEKEIIAKAKKYIRLVITPYCNLNCYYCHQEMIDWTTGKEKSSEVILNELKTEAKNGVKKLKITGGEPLLYPNIFKIIVETNKLIDEVGITTNGTLISTFEKEICELPKNVHFNVTLNTLDPLEYLRITGKQKLNEVINGISILERYGFPVKINMIVRKKTLTHIPSMIDFVSGRSLTLKLMDLVDSGSPEFVSKKNIYYYLSKHYSLLNNYSESYTNIVIGSSKIQLPVRSYLKNCYKCDLYPCSEGILSMRISSLGKKSLCFSKEISNT